VKWADPAAYHRSRDRATASGRRRVVARSRRCT